ncbi:DUF7266 family protein [Halopelagius longus]|uniref:Secreted glycoprotein n=1 Tax=Halopelagius longus TaxID=1236180 RepID=A0A1H1BKD9_9EURY|nr:hypothetical protein [Halopelagius longus]RDI70819.1 hypothetical protein DWB78_03240 [Halopelagius longus]SDQ52359.1 hypothetical protein SAMN05216278_1836 [Halopelagius longus]
MRESDDRRGPTLAALSGTDRAVSTAIGYVLTLIITTMLVSGLLFASGQFVEDEREQVVREELSTLAEQLAAGVADADRLSSGDEAGTVRVAVDLPTRVAGNAYLVEVSNESTPPDKPNRTVVTLSDTVSGVSASVTVPTAREAAPRAVSGGPLVVVVRDADGDDARELVTTTESLSPDAAAASLGHEELVYVTPSGVLTSLSPDGTKTRYDADAVTAVGPKAVDFDGDGLREIPYVTAAGHVRLVDANNRTQTVATGAKTSETTLAVGTFRGETSVFYANASDASRVYRASTANPPRRVETGGGGVAADAVAGPADYDGDAVTDLAYVESSELKYVNQSANATESTGVAVDSDGVGAPRRLTATDPAEVPVVNTNNLHIVYESGINDTLVTGGVEPAAATGVDWQGDSALEVVYVDSSTNELRVVTLSGASNAVTDGDGNRIAVDTAAGVA